MVRITNGVDTFVVSKGAFDGIYKSQGFTLCCEKEMVEDIEKTNSTTEGIDKENVSHETESDENETVEDTESIESDEKVDNDDLEEKPISQWTKTEIKKFAVEKKINIKGKNPSEAREIVKEYLENNY